MVGNENVNLNSAINICVILLNHMVSLSKYVLKYLTVKRFVNVKIVMSYERITVIIYILLRKY